MTRNTTAARNITLRPMLIAALSVAAFGLQTSTVSAYSESVKQACTGDYFNFCSHTAPGSAKLRRCMHKAGPQLSNRCVKALIKAGLAPRKKLRRRSARR